MREKHLLRMVTLAMMVAIGVVISPILRIEGFCPTAHFVNIVCSVFLGPWYSLLNACIIAFLRMTLMSIPPLAITGQVFGAVLSGLFYKASKGSIFYGCVGEIIGTGIIGAIVSYPVMSLLWGKTGLTWMFYVPSFLIATTMGSTVAFIFLQVLKRNGSLYTIQRKLGVMDYEKSKRTI